MKHNQKIVDTAWAGLAGKYWLPDKPGLCLALVRVVIETALGLPERHIYRHWLKHRVETNLNDATRDPIARDLERSLSRLGWAIPFGDRQPGDIIFDYSVAFRPQWGTSLGHVGILLEAGGQEFILENTEHSTRGLRMVNLHQSTRLPVPTAIALTPLSQFSMPNKQNPLGLPTRCVRLPDAAA